MASDVLRISGDSYFKDGQTYDRDFFGGNLPKLVKDDSLALEYARSAQRKQVLAFCIDMLGIATGIAGVALAIERPDGYNNGWAQVMTNTSLIAAFGGPWFHVKSTESELDAVNAFNDRARFRRDEATWTKRRTATAKSSSATQPIQGE
jgi:hypothetical protein